MNITKDELRILRIALEDAKYEINNDHSDIDNLMDSLILLENKLEKLSKDKRRMGRTSLNYIDDCLKRFVKKINKDR